MLFLWYSIFTVDIARVEKTIVDNFIANLDMDGKTYWRAKRMRLWDKKRRAQMWNL